MCACLTTPARFKPSRRILKPPGFFGSFQILALPPRRSSLRYIASTVSLSVTASLSPRLGSCSSANYSRAMTSILNSSWSQLRFRISFSLPFMQTQSVAISALTRLTRRFGCAIFGLTFTSIVVNLLRLALAALWQSPPKPDHANASTNFPSPRR